MRTGARLLILDGTRVLDDHSVHAGGFGFQNLVARFLGIQAGIDVARGPEKTAFYVVFRSSW